MKNTSLLFFSSLIVSSLFAANKNPVLRIHQDSRAVAAVKEVPLVSYADVLAEATPSVVAVYTSRIVQPSYYQRAPEGMQELFRYFGRPVPESSVGVEPQER